MSAQLALFEPTGAEVGRLALQHLQLAERCSKQAQLAEALGWKAVRDAYVAQADEHELEAAELAMLAELEALAGVHQ